MISVLAQDVNSTMSLSRKVLARDSYIPLSFHRIRWRKPTLRIPKNRKFFLASLLRFCYIYVLLVGAPGP
jgi:hypothetical protein